MEMGKAFPYEVKRVKRASKLEKYAPYILVSAFIISFLLN